MRRLRPADNMTSYLGQSQLRGHRTPVPRNVRDQLLLTNIVCSSEDEYPSIGPNLGALINGADLADIDPEPPTYCLRYCPVPGHHQLLGIANQDGRVAIQDTSLVTPKIPMSGHPCHDNAIFDISWSQDSVRHLVTVSGDQRVRLWDVSGGSGDNVRMNMIREFTGHSRRIKCVEWRPGSRHEFVTGANDNCIMLWDTRARSDSAPDNVIRGAHSVLSASGPSKRRRGEHGTEQSVTVTALAWVDTNTVLSTSDRDGVIKMWDLRKNYSLYKGDPVARTEIHHPGDTLLNGYTSVSLSPCHCYAYVSCLDSKIYKYDIINGGDTPVAVYTGANIKNFYTKMSVSPCGQYIASGSGENWAYLWNVHSPGSPLARLGETMAEVTCVSWCADQSSGHLSTLATASDDMRHQIWRQRLERLDQHEQRYALELLNKVNEKRPAVIPPATPSAKSSRLQSSRTPSLSSKKQTPSIKSFLTPTNVKQGLLTPTNDEKRGLKRRQCSFTDDNSRSESCRNLSASISGLLSSPASKCNFTPDSYKSPTKKVSSSPVKKTSLTPRRLGSPLKNLFSPLREIRLPQSPTANLPNFNIDGRSPRSVNRVKTKKPETNWLTAFAKEKKQSSENVENSKLKTALGALPNSQGFTKTKKSTKKKIVKSK